jgi:hypothetical protein
VSRPLRVQTRLRLRLASLRRLRRLLATSFPEARALVRDPGLAEREETTPADHAAAYALRATDGLLRALADLIESLTHSPLDPIPPPPSASEDLAF